MPIYEYRCEDCGSKFEKLVRRAADAEALECPSCGKKHLQQELSTFAAHSNGGTKPEAMPACPGGRCSNPGMCGMNMN
jgi:putative FmdB family regulatory protein